MKRITINDFSAGIVNASDPMLIPDNACVEMENYEFRDGLYPRKRKAADTSEINEYPFGGIVHAVAVWYPRYMPSGEDSDKVYVVHYGKKISLLWLSNGAFSERVIFSDIVESSKVTFFTSYDKVLVADNVNMGRYISVNKDNDVEYGILGIEAPTGIVEISSVATDNKYADIDDTDTGMTVERGNILQYCYTVEDKYGAESNPSPITTNTAMMFKYPDATTTAGFKYYWKSATIKNLSVAQYTPTQRKTLKYVNLYRRDIAFKEGTIGSSFRLVKRIPLGDANIISTVDSSSANLQDISYDKGVCPASPQMIETNDIVYLAGTKTETMLFPFKFDKYCEITITNNNGIDYVEPVIAMQWTAEEVGIDTWDDYLDVSMRKVRLFHSDMATPIPVIYQRTGEQLKVYAKLPSLTMETANKLYLTFADSSEGVTDSSWDSYTNGRFFNYNVDTWDNQVVFGVNNPLSIKHRIATRAPQSWDEISTYASLYNLSDMNAPGLVKNYADANTVYTPYSTISRMTAYPYNDKQVIAINNYRMRCAPDYHYGDYVKYSLVSVVKSPTMFIFEGRIVAFGLAGGTTEYFHFLKCGNLKFYIYHSYTTDKTYLKVYTGTATAVIIEEIPNTNVLDAFDIKMAVYLSGTKITIRYNFQNYTGYKEITVGDITLSSDVYLFAPNRDVSTSPTSISNSNHVSRFDVIEMPPLSANDIILATYCAKAGITYFQYGIGADGETPTDLWTNTNISYEPKTIKTENNQNQVSWSDIGGQTFSTLAFKKFKEPVQAIIVAPSFMRMQYQNTIIVFTRNTINRIVLSDDIKSLAADAGNVVEEYKSNGLFAKHSLVSGGGSLYWLSETGVMQWNQDTFGNLSYGIIDIPIHQNYIAVWISANSQYLLHDKTSGLSYVYHANTKAWTMFSGMGFDMFGSLDLGSSETNKLLLGKEGERFTTFSEYPGTDNATNVDFKITTKQFFIGNLRPLRFRGIWDKMSVPTSVKALTYNHRLSSEVIEKETLSPIRYEWIYISNGFWGEYVQISLDNVEGLTTLDVDIKEEF